MSKIITITDGLYEKLKGMKQENESFSKVIDKSIENKGNKERVLAMAGTMKEELKNVDSLEYVKKIRKDWKWDRYV
jgi:predicted CopG family antitoxin|tara:strand:+ start:529 stop:756 length:228 start_codon:yes stop_codon:yes gene_type:complete